jgi:hypothetical protein
MSSRRKRDDSSQLVELRDSASTFTLRLALKDAQLVLDAAAARGLDRDPRRPREVERGEVHGLGRPRFAAVAVVARPGIARQA